jgi:hypothetical protein
MTPENLRKLSWRMFMATFFCGIAGIVVIIAVPNSSYRDSTDLAVRVIGYTGLTNFISLVTGVIAWFKGTKHCGWIAISAILLFAPIVLMVAMKFNL